MCGPIILSSADYFCFWSLFVSLYFCVFISLVWLLLLLFQEAVGTMCGPRPSLQTDYQLRRLTLAGWIGIAGNLRALQEQKLSI